MKNMEIFIFHLLIQGFSELFEPRAFKSGVSYEDVAKIYDLIKINTAIIRELDLNTRIWTKE